MSPSQSHDEQSVRREMNGTRPSPLQINRESHLIQKSSSSSSSLSSSASSSLTANKHQRHPVIIYTHSPKIIHTQARDFMALVQKLTGQSQPDDSAAPPRSQNTSSEGNNGVKTGRQDEATSSSVVTDENCVVGDVQVSSSSVSPVFDPPNPFFAEIPLFTPNSSEFFCSPKPFYRYPDYGDLAFRP